MAPVLPALFMAIPGLVHLAEELFIRDKGPDARIGSPKGPEKKSFVMQALERAWEAMEKSGNIPPFIRPMKGMIFVLLAGLVDAAAGKIFPPSPVPR